MSQREPVRELRLSAGVRVYVSDAACVVIEQDFGDISHVFFDANEIDELVSALTVLKMSAAAKRSALEVTQEAQYRIAFGEGAHDL
jgi:hypothetical protein